MTSFPFPARTTTGSHLGEMDGVSLTGYEIYRRIHDGPGIDTLNAASDAAETLARRYEQRQTRITALSKKMNAAWQGSAADAAQSVLPPLVLTNLNAQKALETVKTVLERQAENYGETLRRLEDIPENRPVNRLYNPDELAADVAQAAVDYNNKAHHNVLVYDQYVTQSYNNGRAIAETPYPTLSAMSVPSVAVYRSTGPAASGWSNGQEPRYSENGAPGAGGNHRTAAPSRESQPDATFLDSQLDKPSGENPLTQLPSGDTTTGQQGWGPDPSLARHWIAEGASSGPQPSSPTVKEPDGAGLAASSGTTRKPDGQDRGGQSGRKSGVGPRVGAGDNVAHRSVLQSATATSTGRVSDLGGGVWGVLPLRGNGDDNTERTYRIGSYVDLNELFASDLPAWPAVIGAESDDEDSGDDR